MKKKNVVCCCEMTKYGVVLISLVSREYWVWLKFFVEIMQHLKKEHLTKNNFEGLTLAVIIFSERIKKNKIHKITIHF